MGLPEWCTPLPDAAAMRAIDSWAIEQRHVPSLELMERAGAGVTRAVERLRPDGPVAVVCGKGNNAGDGLVAARLLRESGRRVTVVFVASPEELRGDARENLLRLPGEAPVRLGMGQALHEYAAIVDALLGTGFAGEPRGGVAEAIDAINAADITVVSVDVPSGVDASTGVVVAEAVRAALTVTFHTAKPGLWIHPGKAHTGEVHVIDIGIPRGAPAEASVGLVGPDVLDGLPRRGATSTKFSSGHVVLAGGSRGLMGAPRMSALAAMRAGAGYVTACVPRSQQELLVAGGPPELMTRGLPDEDGALNVDGVEEVLQTAERGGALALGPGLGRAPGALEFARELARRASLPLVLDADGLNAHAGCLPELARRARERGATILTPHAGELARLLDCTSEEIEHERLRHVRAAAELACAVVVLKGDDTLIADPDGHVAVSPGGSPALATAGTGDVLTGAIAALLAQGLHPFAAAAAGVWMHAEAGRGAARSLGAAEGVIATDVIAALPGARAGAVGR
ncbi:MAG TPA: NAD(P)H-hydrate dehydratase [Solirubrobacteraceae bacterium]|jgi:NAD(P)H-hydrate epimerase